MRILVDEAGQDVHDSGTRSWNDERREPAQNLTSGADSQGFHESEPMRSGSTHKTTWHWLWRETVNRLDSLQRRVNEGRDLDAAVEFARYILWSKLPDILKPHDCDGFLKVDSSFLRWKAEELQRCVTECYRLGKGAQRGEQTQLEAISRKLDLIAGQISKIPMPSGTPDAIRLRVLDDIDQGDDRREAPASP